MPPTYLVADNLLRKFFLKAKASLDNI